MLTDNANMTRYAAAFVFLTGRPVVPKGRRLANDRPLLFPNEPQADHVEGLRSGANGDD